MPTATILLVDDEVLIADMVADVLADAGFDVFVAHDSAMALAALAASGIAALVTDINLGCLVDGWAIARRARMVHPELPVIYTTGGAAHDWLVEGVPGSILVAKPFLPARIVAALGAMLAR